MFAAQSYAAVYILAEGIGNAKSMDSSAIRSALANIRELDTVLGQFSFDPNGDGIYNPIVLVVVNGKFEVFEYRKKRARGRVIIGFDSGTLIT